MNTNHNPTHNTEARTVTLALAGFCALGALSAAIPALAIALLVLLALGLLAGTVAVIAAWRRTRPDQEPRVTRSTLGTTGPVAYQEVA
jgi:hypothetical protein